MASAKCCDCCGYCLDELCSVQFSIDVKMYHLGKYCQDNFSDEIHKYIIALLAIRFVTTTSSNCLHNCFWQVIGNQNKNNTK